MVFPPVGNLQHFEGVEEDSYAYELCLHVFSSSRHKDPTVVAWHEEVVEILDRFSKAEVFIS